MFALSVICSMLLVETTLAGIVEVRAPLVPGGSAVDQVWSLTVNGDPRLLYYETRLGSSGAVGRGSSSPQLSPSGRYVASTYRDTLFVFDVQEDAERVGHIGPREHRLLLTEWSPSGDRVLFYVMPPRYVCTHGPVEIVDPQPGYGLYFPLTGRVVMDAVPDSVEVHAWLEQGLLVRRPAQATMEILSPEGQRWSTVVPSDLRQVWASRDSKLVFGQIWRGPEDLVDLVRVDLETEVVSALARGRAAALQFPRTSVGGAHLAYVAYEGDSWALVVDRAAVWRSEAVIQYIWLTDDLIAATSGERARVLDATGRLLQEFPPDGL